MEKSAHTTYIEHVKSDNMFFYKLIFLACIQAHSPFTLHYIRLTHFLFFFSLLDNLLLFSFQKNEIK